MVRNKDESSSPHMDTAIKLSSADVALLKNCNTQQQVRNFRNSLYVRSGQSSDLIIPQIEYTPLNTILQEARLLRLYPTDDLSEHIKCDLEVLPLSELPPFIAIKNARGYRYLQEAIEVDEQSLLISVALERFFRYLRTRIQKPTLIWVRYACVVEFCPEEQKTYWTREFSDKMYAMASDVFDMHEINNRLIENEYFEKVVDRRYTHWKKEWYRMPKEVVLPRICPVRLGTKPDNQAPTSEFQYMPLDMIADEVRVICVMPAPDITAPLVMHVAHCPIQSDVTFIGLSYRWGTDVTLEQVTLNGQTRRIRRNLAEAIRFIRETNTITPLWIDAISINQDDIIERGKQVRRMGQIYKNATMVCSWIGHLNDDTKEALDFMTELRKHPVVRFNDANEFHFGEWGSSDGNIWFGQNNIKPARLAELCAALYKVLTRQYFRRAWVLQEIAWASNPKVFAGHKLGASFDTLDQAAYNLHDMMRRDPSLAGKMKDADFSIDVIDIDQLAHARKLFYFRYLISKGHGGGGGFIPFFTIKKSSPEFLDALILARDFECTDPRDRIYALWSLAQDKAGLKLTPGYDKPYYQVYVEFAQAWVAQHGVLDILGAVESTQESIDFYAIIPSWCPNWNVRATASCLVRKDRLPPRLMPALDDQSGKIYLADGDFTRETLEKSAFSFDGQALHCTGLVLDQINIVFNDAPDIPAGTAPKSSWRFHYWAETIKKYLRDNSVTTYDDPLRAIWAMLHGDSIAAWEPVAGKRHSFDKDQYNEPYSCVPALSRHISPFADSYDRAEARYVVDTVLQGRIPFVTEDGYIGLAPMYVNATEARYTQPESPAKWQLAVVAGCSVPLLLRERENGTYELCGTCFVQGWMDGEWIERMMGAGSSKDFWETMIDVSTLVIT